MRRKTYLQCCPVVTEKNLHISELVPFQTRVVVGSTVVAYHGGWGQSAQRWGLKTTGNLSRKCQEAASYRCGEGREKGCLIWQSDANRWCSWEWFQQHGVFTCEAGSGDRTGKAQGTRSTREPASHSTIPWGLGTLAVPKCLNECEVDTMLSTAKTRKERGSRGG